MSTVSGEAAELGMRLRIGRTILVTQPCSFASQVISEEDSDWYWPYFNREGITFQSFRRREMHTRKSVFSNSFAAIA